VLTPDLNLQISFEEAEKILDRKISDIIQEMNLI